MQLSEKELKRYRKIGQECAGIVEGVAMNARPGQTEQEIADKIRTGCIARGISPDCVLVGSDERRYELSSVFSESNRNYMQKKDVRRNGRCTIRADRPDMAVGNLQ